MRIPILVLGLIAATCVGASAQSVGVTAAVNQSAVSIVPGQATKTIYLGDQIIHNQKIVTNGKGLLQILLADGTSFTVGPNSSLTIDSFVYDPDKGTAKIVADLGTGVFRFIGGTSSKQPDGVTLNTPVGTVGIQGGISNLDFSGATPYHIDMVYGVGVTLTDGTKVIGDLYHSGYSIVIGTDGKVGVQKTPPEWTTLFQTQMVGNGKGGKVGGNSVASSLKNTNKTNNNNSNPDENGTTQVATADNPGLISTWGQINSSDLAGTTARYDGTYDADITYKSGTNPDPTKLGQVEDKQFALDFAFATRTGTLYLASPFLPADEDDDFVPSHYSHGHLVANSLETLGSIWIPVAADDKTGLGEASFGAAGGARIGGLLPVTSDVSGLFLNTGGAIANGVTGTFDTSLTVGRTTFDMAGAFGGNYTPPD